jgi:hypothetical protein
MWGTAGATERIGTAFSCFAVKFMQVRGYEFPRIHLLRLYEKGLLGSDFGTLAHMRKAYPTDLSDKEWKIIEPHMPTTSGYGRPRIHSLRERS